MKTKRLAAILGAGALFAATAGQADIIDSWNLNLSLIGTGGTDATDIDYISVTGEGTVQQTVSGGSALGQSFTENGYLQMAVFAPEAGGLVPFDLPDGYLNMYLSYENLTGTLNSDASISFDPYAGSVYLVLGNDAANDFTRDGDDLIAATFEVISPSGGSNLDFYGGSAANSTIDVTLELISTYNNVDLFTDSADNLIDPGWSIHLVNTDSLLDDDYTPNPDNSGVDPQTGDGVSLIYVENSGQYKIALLPEPHALMLMGLGLIGMAIPAVRRRRS